jgi:hypothetical protein
VAGIREKDEMMSRNVARSRRRAFESVMAAAAVALVSGCATVQQMAEEVSRVAAAPASGGGATLGRTIEAEVRDSVTYRFHAEEGAEVYAVLENRVGSEWPNVEAVIRNPTNTARLAAVRVGGRRLDATRVVRPAESGEHVVTVYAHGTSNRTPVAPFRLSLRTINRAPESLTARIAPGVVVSGESIDDFHDVDEFVFAANAGQTITVALQGLSGRTYPNVQLEVIAPFGNVRVANVSSAGNAVALETNTTRPVTLRESGEYTIRVTGEFQTNRPNPYRFKVDVR